MKKRGHPKVVGGVVTGEFIGFDNTHTFKKLLNEQGLPVEEHHFVAMSANHPAHWALVKQGLGVGGMLADIGDADPDVERVLPQVSFLADEIWLVVHRELRTNKRVKRVFDFWRRRCRSGFIVLAPRSFYWKRFPQRRVNKVVKFWSSCVVMVKSESGITPIRSRTESFLCAWIMCNISPDISINESPLSDRVAWRS